MHDTTERSLPPLPHVLTAEQLSQSSSSSEADVVTADVAAPDAAEALLYVAAPAEVQVQGLASPLLDMPEGGNPAAPAVPAVPAPAVCVMPEGAEPAAPAGGAHSAASGKCLAEASTAAAGAAVQPAAQLLAHQQVQVQAGASGKDGQQAQRPWLACFACGTKSF